MTSSELIPLVGFAAVLAVTPGPDTLLSLRYGLLGRRTGVAAATGTSLALFAWAALAGTGVAATLRASPTLYESLKVVGGGYLAYLGVRTLRDARTSTPTVAPRDDEDGAPPARSTSTRRGTQTGRAFMTGVLTCLTNPKTGLFFVALLPQLAPPHASVGFIVLGLGGVVALVVYAYLLLVAVSADAVQRHPSAPRLTRALETVSGVALLGIGLVTGASAALNLLTT